MNTNNEYVNKIWSLDRKNIDPASGMGGYRVRFDIQREYYNKLSLVEKESYEEAVLILCQSDEVMKAEFAFYLCSELKDVFPSDWEGKVSILVEKLVESGLQSAYTNTTTYAVLGLIWSFNIHSLIPPVKAFREEITRNLKQGSLSKTEWVELYSQISRILIKVAPEDFWKEFDSFYKDRELLSLLGESVISATIIWASFGAVLYGLDWLKKLTTEYSKFSDQTLKAQAIAPIEKSSNMVLINHPSEKNSIKGFLEWFKRQLGGAG